MNQARPVVLRFRECDTFGKSTESELKMRYWTIIIGTSYSFSLLELLKGSFQYGEFFYLSMPEGPDYRELMQMKAGRRKVVGCVATGSHLWLSQPVVRYTDCQLMSSFYIGEMLNQILKNHSSVHHCQINTLRISFLVVFSQYRSTTFP